MFEDLLKIRQIVKEAIEHDFNINHIITYLGNDMFLVDIFSDGYRNIINPKSKEMLAVPQLISTYRSEVHYKYLTRFLDIIYKMINIYSKNITKKFLQ